MVSDSYLFKNDLNIHNANLSKALKEASFYVQEMRILTGDEYCPVKELDDNK